MKYYLQAWGHDSSSHGQTWQCGSSASCPPRATRGLSAAASCWGHAAASACRQPPDRWAATQKRLRRWLAVPSWDDDDDRNIQLYIQGRTVLTRREMKMVRYKRELGSKDQCICAQMTPKCCLTSLSISSVYWVVELIWWVNIII